MIAEKDKIRPAGVSYAGDAGETAGELELAIGRRYLNREWLAQVDFWESMKEFILKRIPLSSRPVDQLY